MKSPLYIYVIYICNICAQKFLLEKIFTYNILWLKLQSTFLENKQTIFLYTFLCHVYQLETAVVLAATDSPLIVCRSDSKSNQLQMLTVSGLQLIVTVIWYGVGICQLPPLSKEHKETFLGCFEIQSFPFGSCFCFLCTCIYLSDFKTKLRMS